MADNIDTKKLNQNLKTLTTSSGSGYNLNNKVFTNLKTAGITNSASSASQKINALTGDISNNDKQILKKCESEDFHITPRDEIISGTGFTFKEINPPKQNKNTSNNSAQPGTPSFPPPLTRGVVCGTGKGNANLDFSFNCNFVAGINLDSCLFKFQKEIKIYLTKLQKYSLSLVTMMFPFLDWTTKQLENLCQMFIQIQKVICFIQQLISCILNTITAIVNIINWIMTMPIRILQSLIQCVTSFFGNIVGSLGSLTGALTFIASSLFGSCAQFNCPSINDIGDITDISNVATDIGNAAGKMI